MPKPDLELVSANLHNDRGPTNWLKRRSRKGSLGHFDIACVSEAQRRRRQLRRFSGHDYYTGRSRGPAQETGILMRKDLPDLGKLDAFLSPAAPRFSSVGKERWGQLTLSEVGGVKFGVISLHPVAAPKALQGGDPNHPLVKRYAMAMRWLEAALDYLDANNYQALVGSDIQMMEGWDAIWSPRHVFKERRMWTFWHRIDVIAGTRGFVKASTTTHDIGSDHPALRVGVNLR